MFDPNAAYAAKAAKLAKKKLADELKVTKTHLLNANAGCMVTALFNSVPFFNHTQATCLQIIPPDLQEGLMLYVREVACGDPSCAPIDTIIRYSPPLPVPLLPLHPPPTPL